MSSTEVLFTRQKHDAYRAGLHYDYRVVIGDKAYSWATKKQLPDPGKSIILHEQPIHDRDYALSKKVVIPKGQYGGGTTVLEFASKGRAEIEQDKYVIKLNSGQRFLIKKMPQYGDKQWLMFNITGLGLDKKAAADNEEVEPSQAHQERALKKLKTDHPRLIAFHGLGSGKTKTGLRAIQDALRKNEKAQALFITPASLTKNVDKEQKKHKIPLDTKRFKTLSYEKAVRNIDQLLKKKHAIIALDEAHKLRNEDTHLVEKLQPLLNKSESLLLLSGSPLYNEPKDIGALINVAAGKKVLPGNKRDFDREFIKEKKVNPNILQRLLFRVKPGTKRELKNTKKLEEVFQKYIDYYEPEGEAKAFYPRKEEETVSVPMSEDQERVYKFLEDKVPPHIKWKIRMGLPPSKSELAELNSFASGLRQVSNTHGPFKKLKAPDEAISPKIERAVSDMLQMMNADKNFRGVLYSNYLSAGIHPASAALTRAGVKHGVFTGELSANEKADLVRKYNTGKINTLLVSSSGGEGMDLIGTKYVGILEPHFNRSKIDQVIGRGVRYKSHLHLPEGERVVKVKHYLSSRKQSALDKLLKIKSRSIDEYLKDRSDEKQELTTQVKSLLQKSK